MNLALDRGLTLLEHLSRHPDGLPLALMAEELDIPLSACHRLLADLQQRGYVRQKRKQGDYQLTTKVVSIGLGYLSQGGIVDIAGPLLERLAQASGELVRLSIVDDDRLTELLAQGLDHGADLEVGKAAGRIRDDHADRLGRFRPDDHRWHHQCGCVRPLSSRQRPIRARKQ